MKTKILQVLLAGLILVLLAGCGPSTAEQNGESGPPPGVTEVSINDFVYDPAEVTIQAGETVQWVNNDSSIHTVTSEDGMWESGNINSNGSFSFTFEEPGTYTYYCEIHPDMTGSVIVTE